MFFWYTVAICALVLGILIAASVSKMATEMSNLRAIFEVIYHDDLHDAYVKAQPHEAQPHEVVN